jgi:Kef-type K+ transport system membrane component KefB
LSLALVGGITWFANSLVLPSVETGRLTLLIGFVLLAATLAGGLAAMAGLPRLTGFLVVGIVAGPSVLGLVSGPDVVDLRLIDRFALALIALLAGGEMKVQALKARARPILATTLGVTLVVWAGMIGVMLLVRPLVPFLAELPFAASVGVAILLGVWMANSSPDLTVAVIEETHASGDFVDVVLGVTIVKDIVVIVLFTLALNLVGPLIQEGAGFDAHVFAELAVHVGGAVVAGALLGWVFSRYLGEEDGRPKPPLATFLFAYVLVVIADRLHLELLLTGVAAGFVIENLSPAGDRMIRGIEAVSVVIFAFFFAIAGAGLDLAAIGEFWLAALILFAGRLVFTWAGARAGAVAGGASERVRTAAWQGLVSQGGVSLLLILAIEDKYPSVGAGVVALATAVIIANILGGPILLKRALARTPGNRGDS